LWELAGNCKAGGELTERAIGKGDVADPTVGNSEQLNIGANEMLVLKPLNPSGRNP